MKDIFPEYYRPEGDDFKKLWDECLFVFDANILLDLYRYSEESREDLLGLLEDEKIAARIWIPYQVAFEFQKNRYEVVFGKQNSLEKLEQVFVDGIANLIDIVKKQGQEVNNLNRLQGAGPIIDIDALIGPIEREVTMVSKLLTTERGKIQGGGEDDEVRRRLDRLFLGKVGEKYQIEKLREVCAEGRARFEKKVPPGFIDFQKKLTDATKNYSRVDLEDVANTYNQFGDLLVWKQLLTKMSEGDGRSAVFVTGDGKEDWLLRIKGKVVGPYPELIREALDVARQPVYIYPLNTFYRYAKEYVNQPVKPETVAEVETQAMELFEEALTSFEDYIDSGKLKVSWHKVRANAPTQLKAFILPAQAHYDSENEVIFLFYKSTHIFHLSQTVKRAAQLRELANEVLRTENVLLFFFSVGDDGEAYNVFDTATEKKRSGPRTNVAPRMTTLQKTEFGPYFDFANFLNINMRGLIYRAAVHKTLGQGVIHTLSKLTKTGEVYVEFEPDLQNVVVSLPLSELDAL